jgi:ketosteroid isomerase-like protein
VVLTLEDRLALRSLVDAYAEAVDRKDAEAVAALFAPDGRMVVPDPERPGAVLGDRSGRAEILDALGHLDRYTELTHVVGGQVLRAGPVVTGVTTCVANHVYDRHGETRLLVMGIHYRDTYARDGDEWCFAERDLRIGWRDDRILASPR